jgi:hypothetical protein
MSNDVEITTTMTAELKVDCYDGPNSDQHKKYWNVYCEGDKQDDEATDPLTLTLEQFPPGTKITVEEPHCPMCWMTPHYCECGFDWKTWVEEQYS